MANTILHEVRHFRHYLKILQRGEGYRGWRLLSPTEAERFATATNIWQGKMLGLSEEDLKIFEAHHAFYRGPGAP